MQLRPINLRGRSRLKAVLLALACCAVLVVTGAPGASGQGRVAGCRPFTVLRGHDKYSGSFSFRASSVKRASDLTCRMARNLLKAAYDGGPLKVIRTVYDHDAAGRRIGRPTYWLRQGWRCSNGAGGAACWNVEHLSFDVIYVEGAAYNMAVTANTSFRG